MKKPQAVLLTVALFASAALPALAKPHKKQHATPAHRAQPAKAVHTTDAAAVLAPAEIKQDPIAVLASLVQRYNDALENYRADKGPTSFGTIQQMEESTSRRAASPTGFHRKYSLDGSFVYESGNVPTAKSFQAEEQMMLNLQSAILQSPYFKDRYEFARGAHGDNIDGPPLETLRLIVPKPPTVLMLH